MTRTPAQYAADRRRSHKAKAKREQIMCARMFGTLQTMKKLDGYENTVRIYSETLASVATMARKHLNFVLTGEYVDFV